MKNQVKAKEDLHSQQFIFRPRAFTINRVFEVDKSTLRKLLANDGFSEWQELLYEEDTENVTLLPLDCKLICMFHLSINSWQSGFKFFNI